MGRVCKLAILFLVSILLSVDSLPRDGRLRSGKLRQRSNPNSNVQCGGDLTASSGDIKSPNFPLHYPDEVECIWKIKGDQGTRVTLTFTDFEVENSHSCEYDSLEVYNGDMVIISERVAKLCGSSIPLTIVSTGSTVLLRFHSDFSMADMGFRLQYTRSGCSHRYSGMRGSITSPNYPDNHPLSVSCNYLIEVPSGLNVALSFQSFDLEVKEDSSGCVYDYVEVFDGSQSDTPSLGKFCGNQIPPPVRSSSNSMLVNFVADQSISQTGFRADFRAEHPVVSNPCLVNNGGCNHICTKTGQARRCSCNHGYALEFDDETCRDINECRVSNGGCRDACINTLGSYYCQCRAGYTLAQDNRTCVNHNECATKNHRCEQLCRDTDGSYYCECHKGYQVGPDGMSCTDLNECLLPRSYHHCDHICINTPGSYYCKCRSGFILSANGRICRDQNECVMGGVKCDQLCINTPGSYHCTCFNGFRANPRLPNKCVDIDECLEGLPDCHKCFNSEGSYHCECDKGYSQVANRTRCTDVDECMANNGGCSQLCINMAGGYHCKCEAGYNATDPESRTCVDINECEWHDGKGDCDHMCTNSAGSFKCSCHKGYQLDSDGLTCRDINECAVNNGGCSHMCVNSRGNYACACHNGFLNIGRNGTDVICQDIDECATGIHQCGNGATCINSPGNYTCTCPTGFNPNWYKCNDINECNKPLINHCQQLCNNTAGSFHCQCREGYVLNTDGKTCSDVDECGQGMCERDCVNIQGSYLCLCPTGYKLADDKQHCQDINECGEVDGICDQTCVNTNGSYYCQCQKGYELLGDGKTCRDLDECSLDTACCNQDCVNTEGAYNCTCRKGYALTSQCTCTDVNECANRNGECQQICTNKPGSYGCSCSPGFVVDSLDPTRCQDIDECKTGNGGCQHNCTNTIGTYQCTCHPKFKLQADGKSCGHCPTCDDFESLLETVRFLKKQVASFEAWRQSTQRGCVDHNYEFHAESSSWKKTTCDICSCERGVVRCEPLMGCSRMPAATSATPSIPAYLMRGQTNSRSTNIPTSIQFIPLTDDDDTDTSSADGPTTGMAPSAPKSEQDSDGLFTINKQRKKQ